VKRLRQKVLLIIQVLVVCLVAASVYFSLGNVTVINASSSMIESGSIAIRNSNYRINNLKPGEQITFWYSSDEGDHYDVSIKLASGKELRDRLGYICIGNANRDRITVSDTALRDEFSSAPLEIWTLMHVKRSTENSP